MSIENDWRFAELIVRCWTEPDLRERYLTEPHAVLAEVGLVPAPGEAVPELPTGEELEVVVDRFDGGLPGTNDISFCFSFCEPLTGGAGQHLTPVKPQPQAGFCMTDFVEDFGFDLGTTTATRRTVSTGAARI